MPKKNLPKDIKAKRKGLLYIALVVVMFFILELTGVINFLETPIQKIFTPVQAGLSKSRSDVQNFFSTISDIKSLKQKETELAYENALLLAENARLSKLEEENNTLREQLDAERVGSRLLVADVIGSDGLVVSRGMLIAKGKRHGVRAGSLVIVKNIMVGQVVSVGDSSSRVQLLADPQVKIPAETENGVGGLLSGQFGSSILLEQIEQGKKVNKGEIVFTTGEADIPKDLVLGTIGSVKNDPADLFQEANVEPILPYESLEIVFVVLE